MSRKYLIVVSVVVIIVVIIFLIQDDNSSSSSSNTYKDKKAAIGACNKNPNCKGVITHRTKLGFRIYTHDMKSSSLFGGSLDYGELQSYISKLMKHPNINDALNECFNDPTSISIIRIGSEYIVKNMNNIAAFVHENEPNNTIAIYHKEVDAINVCNNDTSCTEIFQYSDTKSFLFTTELIEDIDYPYERIPKSAFPTIYINVNQAKDYCKSSEDCAGIYKYQMEMDPSFYYYTTYTNDSSSGLLYGDDHENIPKGNF